MPKVLIDDARIAADHERFRHAVNAPLDSGAAALVGAGRGERIAVAAKKATRIVGVVLVVDADKAQARILRELHQERRFFVAWHAPRCPHIHHGHGALEFRMVDRRHPKSV